MLEGWGGDASARFLRAPSGSRSAHRNVAEASGNLRRMLSVRAAPGSARRHAAGRCDARESSGANSRETMRREWFTLGVHLGYRYEGSPICWPDGSAAAARRSAKLCADGAARASRAACLASPTAARRSICSAAALRCSASARMPARPRRSLDAAAGSGSAAERSSRSTSRRSPRSMSANSCWCARTATSPGATIACRTIRSRVIDVVRGAADSSVACRGTAQAAGMPAMTCDLPRHQ